jgi:hypothetical protein
VQISRYEREITDLKEQLRFRIKCASRTEAEWREEYERRERINQKILEEHKTQDRQSKRRPLNRVIMELKATAPDAAATFEAIKKPTALTPAEICAAAQWQVVREPVWRAQPSWPSHSSQRRETDNL